MISCVSYFDNDHEPDEPWWYLTRENVWYKANVVAAIAVGVYAIGFRLDDIYDWLTTPARSLVFLIVVLAISVVGAALTSNLVKQKWGRVAGAWSVVGVVFIVFAIGHAVGDSIQQRHSNCWHVSGPDDDEIVACAPEAEPRTGSSFDELSGTGTARYCDQLRVGDGGVSIWRCKQEEF